MTIKLSILLLLVVGLISNSNGDDIVKRLKTRYNNVAKKCSSGGKTRPAYECSGILIRGVNDNLKFALDMKPLNKKKDAFSIGFLRRDQVFPSLLNYESGFIVYPHMKTPKKKNTYKVFCFFPMDANTDIREGRHGCGKFNFDNTQDSAHCDQLNIKSFNDWKSHFQVHKNNPLARQCAFDMTIKSATKDFAIGLEASKYIRTHLKQYRGWSNELRMHAWSVKKTKLLPIEAFFYLIDSQNGKHLAAKHQDEFYKRSRGVKVPIIGIRFPKGKKKLKIEYYKRNPKKHK